MDYETIKQVINEVNEKLDRDEPLQYASWKYASQDIMTKEEALQKWYKLISQDDNAKEQKTGGRTMEEFVKEETIYSAIGKPKNGETIVETTPYIVWIDHLGYIGLIKKGDTMNEGHLAYLEKDVEFLKMYEAYEYDLDLYKERIMNHVMYGLETVLFNSFNETRTMENLEELHRIRGTWEFRVGEIHDMHEDSSFEDLAYLHKEFSTKVLTFIKIATRKYTLDDLERLDNTFYNLFGRTRGLGGGDE